MDWIFSWSHVNVRTVLLGLSVFAFLFWLIRRPRNLPPGPWGWPLLGNIPQLAMMKEPLHVALSKLSDRYGPILSFKVANQLVVVLQDYDVIKEAMDQYQLSGRPPFELSQLTLPGYGVLTASGEPWVELRRFSATALRKLGMGKASFEQQISTEAKHLIEEMRGKGAKSFDPRDLLENAVANVICYLVFGSRFEYSDDKLKHLLKMLNESVELGGEGGLVEFVPIFSKLTFLPVVKKHIAVDLAFQKMMGNLLKEHEKGYQPGILRDYTDAFYAEMKAKESKGLQTFMNPVSLFYSVSSLFGAGTETTTTTLRWALLFMIAYPEIQTRVQQEIDSVVGRNRLPRLSDKPELPYTNAVLCETQRHGSIVPFGLPHKCIEDTSLAGYHIPEGAMLLANLWHTQNDSREWANPKEFRPERFLDSTGKFIRREKHIPFGSGRRLCLGEQLAKMELYIVFTSLLHQFTFRTPEGVSVSLEATDAMTRAPLSYQVLAIPRD